MNRRVISTFMLLATAWTSFSGTASAIVIQPNNGASKDTFAYQFLPTFNFNSGGAFSFEPVLAAGVVSGGHDSQSFLQFDLTGVSTATSATLELFVTNTTVVNF